MSCLIFWIDVRFFLLFSSILLFILPSSHHGCLKRTKVLDFGSRSKQSSFNVSLNDSKEKHGTVSANAIEATQSQLPILHDVVKNSICGGTTTVRSKSLMGTYYSSDDKKKITNTTKAFFVSHLLAWTQLLMTYKLTR